MISRQSKTGIAPGNVKCLYHIQQYWNKESSEIVTSLFWSPWFGAITASNKRTGFKWDRVRTKLTLVTLT